MLYWPNETKNSPSLVAWKIKNKNVLKIVLRCYFSQDENVFFSKIAIRRYPKSLSGDQQYKKPKDTVTVLTFGKDGILQDN